MTEAIAAVVLLVALAVLLLGTEVHGKSRAFEHGRIESEDKEERR
jgi:hypothetical protein